MWHAHSFDELKPFGLAFSEMFCNFSVNLQWRKYHLENIHSRKWTKHSLHLFMYITLLMSLGRMSQTSHMLITVNSTPFFSHFYPGMLIDAAYLWIFMTSLIAPPTLLGKMVF